MDSKFWTVEALKEHLESKIESIQRDLDRRSETSEKLLDSRALILTTQLERMTKAQDQLMDERKSYVTKSDLETFKSQLSDLIEWKHVTDRARGFLSNQWALVVTFLSVIGAILGGLRILGLL